MIETAMSRRAVLTGAAIARMALPTTGALGAPEPVGAATDGSADVIVIGAPDALTVADRAAVDRFLRERGGSVVLLQDSL